MKRINLYISGEAAREHTVFDRTGPAASVAVLEATGQRAFAAFLPEANPFTALIQAAALGLEALREPCAVRVVTSSRILLEVMTGGVRQVGYWQAWARLERAAGRHRVLWAADADEYDRAVLAAAQTAARGAAAAGEASARLLDEAAARVAELRSSYGRLTAPEDDRAPAEPEAAEPPRQQPAAPRRLLDALLEKDPDDNRTFEELVQPLPRPVNLGLPARAAEPSRGTTAHKSELLAALLDGGPWRAALRRLLDLARRAAALLVPRAPNGTRPSDTTLE